MKAASIVLFCFMTCALKATLPPPDTILHTMASVGPDSILVLYEKEWIAAFDAAEKTDSIECIRMTILLATYTSAGDSIKANALLESIIKRQWPIGSQQAALRFIYNKSQLVLDKTAVYLAFQQAGYKLAGKWNLQRAQYAFLENSLGVALFSQDMVDRERYIQLMQAVAGDNEYLRLRTDLSRAEYLRSRQQDSCEYYFIRFIEGFKPYPQKDNSYFLQPARWVHQVDSGLLASGYRGYALFHLAHGQIQKAGQLLILAEQTLSDTSLFTIRKIENQLSLSTLYADLSNKEKGLEYALKAVALCEERKHDKLRKGRVAAIYARALMINDQIADARAEYEKAYAHFAEGMNKQDPKKVACYLVMLETYEHQTAKAVHWMQTAESYVTVQTDEIDYLMATARGLSKINHYDGLALKEINLAHQLALDGKNVRWLKESLYHLYLLAKAQDHPRESLVAYERYVHFNDSLYRSGQELALFDIEAAYQKTIQDETIARLDAQQEASALKLKSQQRLTIIILVSLVLLAGLCIWLFRLYSRVRAAHATISNAIHEKNILLREIHHRVKNNLQVISSLLKLQSGYVRDENALQAIAEGRSRVQSMALLHQNLYKEDDLTGVNMNEYFDNLIQNLFDTYTISPDKINLHKRIESLVLDVDTVVPLGLITNELISNALKHAFPGSAKGNLFVSLYEENNALVLQVKDDGTGWSSGIEREGFGTKLIQSLSQKLEAEITTRSSHGTEVTLRIKEYKKAA